MKFMKRLAAASGAALCMVLLLLTTALPAQAQDPADEAGPAAEAIAAEATSEETGAEEAETPEAEAEESELSAGDTAWMLTSTALVLFMTIPGLALFYAGLVRSKNALSVMMQCFGLTAVITLVWVVCGYSIAFGGGGNPYFGALDKVFLRHMGPETMSGSIPESVWITFQMTFAIITPALIAGAYAERMRFSSMMIFSILWVILVYSPVCHWVWSSDGWLFKKDVLDFAGGTVVHINAGIAALVAALVLGPRKGYPGSAMPPHSLMFTVVGASMLWVGWFGFNGGSALSAGGTAGMAMLVTQISTATAATVWMMIEWLKHGKPSALGIATGAVAGLVAITPASGTAGAMGAIAIGAIASAVCFWGATSLKRMAGWDDSLDAFGVHGIGGLVGAVLTGVFASEQLGGVGLPDGRTMGNQVLWQFIGCAATLVYSGIMSLVLLKIAGVLGGGLRVNEEQELGGLDLALHDERAYDL